MTVRPRAGFCGVAGAAAGVVALVAAAPPAHAGGPPESLWEPAARQLAPMPVFRPTRDAGTTLRRLIATRAGSRGRGDRCQMVEARYSQFRLGSSGEPSAGRYLRLVQGRLDFCGDLPPVRVVSRPTVNGQPAALLRYGEGPGGRGSGYTLAWRRAGVRLLLITNLPRPGLLVQVARSARRVTP